MTNVITKNKSAWQAEVTRETRYYTKKKQPPRRDRREMPDCGADAAPIGETTETPECAVVETPEAEADETLHRAWVYFVDVFPPDGERIRFHISHRKGRHVSFCDPREQFTGTAGTTGIWGTRPAQPAGKPRSLTPTGFRIELARLIGAERAEEIVRMILEPGFFLQRALTSVGDRTSALE